MTQRIIDLFRANPRTHFHPMTIARTLNIRVSLLLPQLVALRKLRAIKAWGGPSCVNQRYWSI